MPARRTQAYLDARHLLRKHRQHHGGDLRGVIARKPETDASRS